MNGTMDDTGVLEKLFTSPLLARGEVDEENLERLTTACERGIVGCKVFQEFKTKPTVYWLKTSIANKGELTPTAHPTKRKFISPVVGQNFVKRRKQLASSDGPVLKGGGDRNITEKSGSVPSTQVSVLMKEKLVLQQQLEERKEKLRKLKMVKMYRAKNNLEELQTLVNRWRSVSQEVAEELLTKSTRQPPPSMEDLLAHLHVDPSLIHYSVQEEGFY